MTKLSTLDLGGLKLELREPLEVSRARQRPGEQEYRGSVRRPLDRADLRRQLTLGGFRIFTDHGQDGGSFSFVAERQSTIVTLNFWGPPFAETYGLFAHAQNSAAYPQLKTKRGIFSWRGARWPAYFKDGKIAGDDDDGFFVEAEVEDAADTIERYRSWAEAEGFEIEEPLNSWEEEPDLFVEVGLRFRSDRFFVRLEVTGTWLMLYLRPERRA